MSQRYNDNIKRQKAKENQLGILKFTYFARKFRRGPRVQERVLLALRINENTSKKLPHLPPKSCCNFTQWFKEGCNWSIAVTYLRLVSKLHANTSSPGVYRRKQLNWQAHLELCHKNPDILEGCCTGSRYQTQLHGSAHPCKL